MLDTGEPGFDTDAKQFRIGDGSTPGGVVFLPASDACQFLKSVTALTGGTATDLDGQTVSAGDAGRLFITVISGELQVWQFLAGTDAEDPAGGIVRPDSYATTTFEYIYKQVL